MALAAVAIAAVTLLVMRASGQAPDPLKQPGSACWKLSYLPYLPPEKVALLQADCDTQKAALERFERSGGVKVTHTPRPIPSVRLTEPPCDDKWTPTAEMMGCILYGILKDDHQPPPGYEHYFQVNDVWAGESLMVFAGSLQDDTGQGMIVVTDRFISTAPHVLGEYRTPTREGALRILDAQGSALTIVAATGARYSFNADTRALARE